MSALKVILLVLLVLLIIGALPAAGFAPVAWGWGPSGLGAIILIVLLVLILTGRL